MSTISSSLDLTLDLPLAKALLGPDLTNITAETLRKTFESIGASPEKLRALLNVVLTPLVKPTFTIPSREDDNNPLSVSSSGLEGVEFLLDGGTSSNSSSNEAMPYRMFDIATGNLVEYPSVGGAGRGQYCMLSHRWKGTEVTLGNIKEARKKALERARAGVGGSSRKSGARKSDVALVLEQCRLDILEQASLVTELELLGGGEGDEDGGDGQEMSVAAQPVGVGELLKRRLEAKAAEYELGGAQDSEAKARSGREFAKMEQKMFARLVEKMKVQVGGTNDTAVGGGGESETVVKEFDDKVKDASKALRTAQENHKKVRDHIEYFRTHGHLRDAVDEMVSRLQRWKSAIKLDRSLKEADRIFKTKMFQPRETCYLWSDTCCIDKTNGGELSDSLSLMGDWYADAEFTLVQLDTKFREDDAVKDWERFEKEEIKGQEQEKTEGNITTFGQIWGSEIEWATRAWTLQELVMSKTTFYVNSAWQPLSRPVESLGYFYSLIPFLDIYTEGDKRNVYRSVCGENQAAGYWDSSVLKKILDDEDVLGKWERFRDNIQGTRNDEFGVIKRLQVAQQLILLLDYLGVQIPSNLTVHTSTAAISRAVYLATADLVNNGNDELNARQRCYSRLRDHLPKLSLSEPAEGDDAARNERNEHLAQHAIGFLLRCLVAETKDLVYADREYIAQLGQIPQLESWKKGLSSRGFTAEAVLQLSGNRFATVATDRAYALMGILGVRFPTFPAEGPAKALARLLDEVVISRSDVSVFNWSGTDMGSPIRGRSLYPSSQTAYANQVDQIGRYNLMLAARVQDKMDEVMATYHSVIQTLRDTIDILKDKSRTNLPIHWIQIILELIGKVSFRKLRVHRDPLKRVITYIHQQSLREKMAIEQARKMMALEEAKPRPGLLSSSDSWNLKRPAILSTKSLPSIPSLPSLSRTGSTESTTPTEKTSSSKKTSRFGLGKKAFQVASSGIQKTGLGSSLAAPESPADPPPPPCEEVESKPSEPERAGFFWQHIDSPVTKWLSALDPDTGVGGQEKQDQLPAEIQSIPLNERHGHSQNGMYQNQHPQSSNIRLLEDEYQGTVSPNPITVSTSGIEGLFDIQRIIVTMIEPEKLRRQIARAASRHDQISGWCSVSTGFARVLTSFRCERHILEQELDVIESVETRVVFPKSLPVTKGDGGDVQPSSDDNKDNTDNKDKNPGTTTTATANMTADEARRLQRMLTFIQNPSLHLVAGEWVLARFSHTPCAQWFLCHFTLGADSSTFHGVRIPTGSGPGSNATLEPGFIGVWESYMERKKSKMSKVVRQYMRSQEAKEKAGDKFLEGLVRARAGLEAMMGEGGPISPAKEEGKKGGEGDGEKKEGGGQEDDEEEEEDDDDDESLSSLFKMVVGQGARAAEAWGESAYLVLTEKLHEMRADHLERNLSRAVLKRTPKVLRAAVENIHDNRNLLPAMFHSGVRVHMF
ncbi:uncharacterized protein C8A04DRAFT_12379 [Dichotomopilus funicola]|uniref:Heterokaryon incompatibility domain-containing protein n=1 Tax=Dichotomopilus funicola TaxID=1934379 RepID=A0AAN6V2Q8_9PEZI|nr:hypothetical protein C8A04DRAFT_12379 [Dichotomopilus funicola]